MAVSIVKPIKNPDNRWLDIAEVADKVFINPDQLYELERRIYYLSLDIGAMRKIHDHNSYLLKKEKNDKRAEYRAFSNSDRTTTEKLNKLLQEDIAEHEKNESDIKRLENLKEATIRIAEATKSEKIYQMHLNKLNISEFENSKEEKNIGHILSQLSAIEGDNNQS